MLLWLSRISYFSEHLSISILNKSSHSTNWQIWRKISVSVCLWSPLLNAMERRLCEVFYSLMKNLNKTARTFLLGHIIICLTLNVIFLRDFASRYLGLWVLELKLNLELFWFHLLSGLVLKVSVLRVPVFRVLVIKVLVFSVPAPGFRLSRITKILKI